MADLMSSPAMGGYTVTKHAVVALSRVLRIEARRHGVRVSVLCPGVIRTPILEGGRYGRLTLDPALFARRALRAVEAPNLTENRGHVPRT
jgi:NAD(P)-dependent dehydrogenase (short-subunit alcohol dehydrogenase family)